MSPSLDFEENERFLHRNPGQILANPFIHNPRGTRGRARGEQLDDAGTIATHGRITTLQIFSNGLNKRGLSHKPLLLVLVTFLNCIMGRLQV